MRRLLRGEIGTVSVFMVYYRAGVFFVTYFRAKWRVLRWLSGSAWPCTADGFSPELALAHQPAGQVEVGARNVQVRPARQGRIPEQQRPPPVIPSGLQGLQSKAAGPDGRRIRSVFL